MIDFQVEFVSSQKNRSNFYCLSFASSILPVVERFLENSWFTKQSDNCYTIPKKLIDQSQGKEVVTIVYLAQFLDSIGQRDYTIEQIYHEEDAFIGCRDLSTISFVCGTFITFARLNEVPNQVGLFAFVESNTQLEVAGYSKIKQKNDWLQSKLGSWMPKDLSYVYTLRTVS